MAQDFVSVKCESPIFSINKLRKDMIRVSSEGVDLKSSSKYFSEDYAEEHYSGVFLFLTLGTKDE
jgi:hypothetical protein